MKALDTNVLIRFLVRDDERQAGAVYGKFKEAEAARQVFLVPLLVVLETIWVLESAYSVKRGEIREAIDELLSMPILEFESQAVIRRAMSSAKESNVDLADLLIGHSALHAGCECVLTFDKRAAKNNLFELLR